jgi:hypothetical protein
MGNKTSKLSPEQLAELQKNTYCALRLCDGSRGGALIYDLF